MYLKSLTLRGFKSFAGATTLRFEPGITCVVGPNGSGKSNVVDALAWVMGEQGAKTLRGEAMADVIFAGTTARPPLGRAEVVLTIDNSDGALPIDYAEVTIGRLLFRGGSSEYAINGDPCRLLDVQELLSDVGLGREMHVIVGQGQLEAVLAAGPEERRGFIEEAAGVLKHRRRKEKALRKLDAMGANLTRLTDLIAELRRQLGPLGRQAEVARRASAIQAALRDAELRLLADDLVGLRTALETELHDEAIQRERRSRIEEQLTARQGRVNELEADLVAAAPRLARAQETWYQLGTWEERLRALVSLASQRARHLAAEPPGNPPGRDPDELAREAAALRGEERELAAGLEADRHALADAVTRRTEAEAAYAAEETRLAAARQAVADRREGLATLAGQVAAVRSRAEGAAAEIGRLRAALIAATSRADDAQRRSDSLQREVDALDAGELHLDRRHEQALTALLAVEEQLATLTAQERDAERDRSSWQARKEALALGLVSGGKDAAAALLANPAALPGLLGSVADMLRVPAGYETAAAAALGDLADAIAVDGPAAAAAAIQLVKDSDGGRVGVLVGGSAASGEGAGASAATAAPAGAQWAIDVVTCPAALRGAVGRLLAGVVIVEALPDAAALVAADPSLRAVTRAGDVVAPDWAVGGSATAQTALELKAALDEAGDRLVASGHVVDRLRFALAAAREERRRAQNEVAAALAALHDSDARLAAAAEALGQAGAAARAAQDEAARLRRALAEAQDARDRDAAGLTELAERLAAARATPIDAQPSTQQRDQLGGACAQARTDEIEARLTVRTGEERMRALAGRADALDAAAARERTARQQVAQRRVRRARDAALAHQVAATAEDVLGELRRSLSTAAAARERAEGDRAGREVELANVRGQLRELAVEFEQLTDVVHREEMARTEQMLRIKSLTDRCLEEYGVDAQTLVADYGPDVPVPAGAAGASVEDDTRPDGTEDDRSEPATTAYDRAEQQRRLRTAERRLSQLGKVNPLALEEFAALEERHRFLSTQLADLKATRRSLLTVIGEVDERIEAAFASAFEDTAREFAAVFATLFPGGEGRLVLTEPDDLLTTGIDIEARPAGKRVKRLSLLSGGERSLTATALMVAIFRARPSPFYVLDEVEAALDDRNLSRLLALLDGLRESSQLIVATHQKRTMEIADALYGVSMRGDGVTTVISQRLREPASA